MKLEKSSCLKNVGGNIMKGNNKTGLFVSLNSLFLMVLLSLYYSGANSFIIGTYTIFMFIVTSTVFFKMIIKPNESR